MKSLLLYARYAKSLTENKRYKNVPDYENIVETFLIEEKGFHCYFGYYDKSPINRGGSCLLYLKVKDGAVPTDIAEVCIYDMKTGYSRVVGSTNTWNWQQGAMEQWISDEKISYNRFNSNSHSYETVISDIKTSTNEYLNRATYAYNKDYTKSLSLNFYRLDVFAKGYGYPYEVDSMIEEKDGIWEQSIPIGNAELILPLSEVIAYNPHYIGGVQHYINHVTYCPDENYIMFIHRWQEKGGTFTSRLLLYNLKERKLSTILDNAHVSHYCWKSDRELLIYATDAKGHKGYMLVNIYNGNTTVFAGLPDEDGHPSYSNDKQWILTDTYPDKRRNQYLFLYDSEGKRLFKVDELHSPFRYYNDFRCDLHPRWSSDNRYLIVDNTATGLRSLKIYKIKH